MRLVDLNPSWVGAGGPGVTRNGHPVPERHGVGVALDCPGCRDDSHKLYVPFSNPIDGGEMYEKGWQRTGDTFESLTLAPSIKRLDGCRWHGFIRNGAIETC